MELNSERRLADRYKVVGCLGTGAYGPVFLAKDEKRDDSLVAVKVFHRGVLSSQKARATLKESLSIIRTQGSGELIKPLNYIHSDELQAVAMEYIPGEDLASKVARAELRLTELRDILRKIAVELHRLHERNVVHNDICPSHILIAENGSIKLAGFPGYIGEQPELALPMSLRVGTAHYKAPEYLRAGKRDQRSDVYSLGVMGLELLSRLAEDAEEGHSREWLRAILEKASASCPEDRFASAFELASALDKPEPEENPSYSLGVKGLSAIVVGYSSLVLAVLYFLSRSL